MIVATTVDHILRLEEAAIVVVTEVEPEAMHRIELGRPQASEAVQGIKTPLITLPSHGKYISSTHAALPCVERAGEKKELDKWVPKRFHGSHNVLYL